MTELLILRLAMVAVIFLFVFAAASTMRGGLVPRATRVRPTARGTYAGPRLILVAAGDTGLAPGTEVAVAGETLIGRDPVCGIVLPDPSVSGRHAVMLRNGAGWVLRDLGSTNGTMVDGRVVRKGGAPLSGGEEIVVGSVRLRFQA